MAEQQSGDLSYRDELGRVLRQRDASALRAFLLAQAQRFGDDRQVAEVHALPEDVLLQRMHRMIVARPDLADLHSASREWLARRGGPGGQPAPHPRQRPRPPSPDGARSRRNGRS